MTSGMAAIGDDASASGARHVAHAAKEQGEHGEVVTCEVNALVPWPMPISGPACR